MSASTTSLQSGPFAGQTIPEIVDFGVLEKFRRRGIGAKLMDAAEQAALQTNSRVCLGIALHAGDQRMYVKRGYAFRTAAVCGGANKSASPIPHVKTMIILCSI